ncbi:MAG: ribonuclease III [bacterium]|nr:ribonuclease III [bacterium]
MDFLEKYNINIKNKELLLTSLTHTSYANEHQVPSYERLEYLGDSVLQLIVSDYLYSNTDLKEGQMSKTRASFVCESALANYAKEIGYIPYIRVGHGQLGSVNETIIADIFEAILGCIYLECGYDTAYKYVYMTVIPHIKKHEIFMQDYKSALQEATQMNRKTLDYEVISESGPAHDKHFVVEVKIDNIVYGRGEGHSKKEAEQKAAEDALRKKA